MTLFNFGRRRSFFSVYKKRQALLNAAVIAGLFAAVLAVSWVAQSRPAFLTWMLAGTLGVWGALILLRLSRFEYGIIAVMLTAGLVNFFTLPTGRESRVVISLVVAMALVGIWIVQLLIKRETPKLRPSPVNLPVILFVIVSIVAYVWSIFMRDPLLLIWDSFPYVQLAALAVNIILPLFGLLVSNKVRETRWLKVLAWTMILLGAFVIAATLLPLNIDRIFRNGARGLFSTWVVSLALAMALFNEKLSGRVRGGLLLLVAAWTLHSFFREGHWLSGWLPFMVSGAVITYLRSRKLFLAALVGLALLAAIKWEAVYYHVYVTNVEEGSAQRTDLWIPNIQLVSRHPLFGTGPAGYAIYYMTYHPQNARSTHNNYFDILAQTGFIGSAIFIWMFGVFISIGNRLRKALRGQRGFKEAFAVATFGGVLAVMVAMMLGDWVIPFAYNQTITGFDNAQYTWVFLGGMVSLYHIMGMGEKK